MPKTGSLETKLYSPLTSEGEHFARVQQALVGYHNSTFMNKDPQSNEGADEFMGGREDSTSSDV